jgi:hypothetical protein
VGFSARHAQRYRLAVALRPLSITPPISVQTNGVIQNGHGLQHNGRAATSISIESHFAALELAFPELLDAPNLVDSRRRSTDFQDADLIVAWLAALQAKIATMTVLIVIHPAAEKPAFTCRRAYILLFRFG